MMEKPKKKREVSVVQYSSNKKISPKNVPCSATYVSQHTCSKTCPFKDNGCYAEKGHVAYTLRRLEAITEELKLNRTDLAKAEAEGIDALFVEGQDLRLHVVGDCATRAAAQTVSAACDRFVERGGGSVWSYTHSWKHVNRGSWGEKVSIMASIHSTNEGRQALKKGYAPAVVVKEHPAGPKAFQMDGITWLPCREQASDVPCTKCRWCFRDQWLKDNNLGIAFAEH